MGNVISLNGDPTPIEPVADVIAAFEALLEGARSGEIRSVIYAITTNRAVNSFATGWQGPVDDFGQLCLAKAILDARFADSLLRSAEDLSP